MSGALGSERNNNLRRKRLLALGPDESQIKQLHGPIGLPIGSRTPAEIAVLEQGELGGIAGYK